MIMPTQRHDWMAAATSAHTGQRLATGRQRVTATQWNPFKSID